MMDCPSCHRNLENIEELINHLNNSASECRRGLSQFWESPSPDCDRIIQSIENTSYVQTCYHPNSSYIFERQRNLMEQMESNPLAYR